MKTKALRGRSRLACGPSAIEPLESRLLMVTFNVTNTNDSGAGSFRQAMLNANASVGEDNIHFAIGSGAKRIQPITPLPTIVEAVLLDGTTQPGFAGIPLIEISGFNGSSRLNANGLTIISSNSVISGLVINGFAQSGVLIGGSSALNNNIHGCFIGTDADGTDLETFGLGRVGIEITEGARGNIIGGGTVSARNIIAGAAQSGVFLDGIDTANNIIAGNYIGVDLSGNYGMGNGTSGVLITRGATHNLIGGPSAKYRNVISGNAEGLVIDGLGTSDNVVQGNYIGTNVLGNAPSSVLSNWLGVQISGGATNNTIGGAHTPERNIISGNDNHGIIIEGIGTSGNTVWNNFIGTNAAGTALVPNFVGLAIVDGATNNAVGSYRTGRGNLISGNAADGILLSGEGVSGNILRQNLIGSQVNPRRALGNGGDGINIINASNNIIGGKIKGSGNLIANNGVSGVNIQKEDGSSASAGQGNLITRNAIFNNAGLGINYNQPVPVLNDALDADVGPNALQNFPVLTSAVAAGGVLTVTGNYTGASNKTVFLEFFLSPTSDFSNFGEGQQIFGTGAVTTAANGQAGFTFNFNVTPPSIFVVTATAVDSLSNTSQFSNAAGTGIVMGLVFNDGNGNGTRQSGEGVFSEVQVFLDLNNNGIFNTGTEPTTFTDFTGQFILAVVPGNYRLRVIPPAGTVPTAGAAGFQFTLTASAIVTRAFGVKPI